MSAEVKFEGLEELKAALRNLPDHLTQQASAIVTAAAHDAERDVQAAYARHRHTGNLERGVTMRVEQSGGRIASARVKSGAKHANIFERGTQFRHTRKGSNRGSMPAAPGSDQMIPIAIRARRRMVANLIEMVQREGLVVTSS